MIVVNTINIKTLQSVSLARILPDPFLLFVRIAHLFAGRTDQWSNVPSTTRPENELWISSTGIRIQLFLQNKLAKHVPNFALSKCSCLRIERL
jgi:hypothetical protein